MQNLQCFREQSRQFTTMGIIYLFAFIGSAEKLYNFKRLKIGSPFSLQINIDRQYFGDKQ